jgi:hypothetical protein
VSPGTEALCAAAIFSEWFSTAVLNASHRYSLHFGSHQSRLVNAAYR